MPEPSILLALKPRFAEAILAGTKTVELRRGKAHAQPGSVGLLYASSPQRALVGVARIGIVESWAPSTIWRKWGSLSGMTKAEFSTYFAGASVATAIEIAATATFPLAVSLTELRNRSNAFVVPQSYRFVSPDESAAILNGQVKHVKQLKEHRPS